MNEPRIWVVRVPKGQDIIEKVTQQKIVAIGFGVEKSIAEIQDRNAIKELYRSVKPEASEGRVNLATGQLYRFAHDIEIGDWVLTPNVIREWLCLER